MKEMEKEINRIAQEILGIDSTEKQWGDSLELFDCTLCDIKAALESAYKAGLAAGSKERKCK